MEKIDLSVVSKAKFIKLGKSGKWDSLCLRDGTIRLGYYEVPHSIALKGDLEGIKGVYSRAGGQAASNHARQVAEFYCAGPETLWITFSNGLLYWAQADREVEYLGEDKARFPDGSRLKRTINGWSNQTLSGKVLRISELSGQLTRSASYRQTICGIKEDVFDYLLRKLTDRDLPVVNELMAKRAASVDCVAQLIRLLTWQDFELLVDLIFSRSGWKRVSIVGGTEKNTDIEYILPITDERVFVQVKSHTDQREFNEYALKFANMSAYRFFYVYHSSPCQITSDNHKIILKGVRELAELCLKTDLVDWLCIVTPAI